MSTPRATTVAFDVDVRSDTSLGFTLGYLFHDNFGVEPLAALPFKHDIRLNGADIASTKHLPPTLTVQYYPLGGTGAQVQPYAGIGLNYRPVARIPCYALQKREYGSIQRSTSQITVGTWHFRTPCIEKPCRTRCGRQEVVMR